MSFGQSQMSRVKCKGLLGMGTVLYFLTVL